MHVTDRTKRAKRARLVLDHILENHGGKLFLEPELDTNQLLTLLEQLLLGFVAKFRNLYV